jgi:adenine-specific DNA-methyltransferase
MPILNWLTRDSDIGAAKRVPYRLLEEAPELSAGDPKTGNMLIQGDNLEALKALLPFYAGQVKCIYIDPPYNTRSAFEHYDDNLEHTQWLAMMWPRLELLRDLLSEDGSIWISIDQNEIHYLGTICDEIFGRKNRINLLTFKQSSVSGPKSINPGIVTISSYILIYSKEKKRWFNKRTYRKRERDPRYTQFITNRNDPAEEWTFSTLSSAIEKHYGEPLRELRRKWGAQTEDRLHKFVLENRDRVVQHVRVLEQDVGDTSRAALKASIQQADRVHPARREDGSLVYFFNGKQIAFYSSKTQIIDGELTTAEPVSDIWDDLLANNVHNEGGVKFDGGKKPEGLVKRILDMITKPGDLILDSFLGSGTTAAVAHKMGRRYIGIEMGEHAVTHCAPRLIKVIDGEQSGISESVGWKGGGGFRFYRLGPPVFDEEGHIRPDIRFPVLAAHIWFSETNTPWTAKRGTPLLGFHDGRAFALLYNGILGDKRVDGGNVLTRATLALIREKIAKKDPAFAGPLTVYGEQSRITAPTLDREGVIFKQTPYDVKARR